MTHQAQVLDPDRQDQCVVVVARSPTAKQRKMLEVHDRATLRRTLDNLRGISFVKKHFFFLQQHVCVSFCHGKLSVVLLLFLNFISSTTTTTFFNIGKGKNI